MKALVVDDSRAIRLILSQILKELGFEVGQAGHGKEALAYLSDNQDTSVALIDWNMPEMNGLELVEAVHKDPRLQSVRMMMVTTENEGRQVQRALEAGAHEYVMKPFTRDMIQDKLRMLGVGN
ncbi:MAG: response regulator [Acidobacteria bacterium]|nr:response regulator [Acidobacteriota bacterium]